ncbi:MAG: M1 family metallopeptidase [Bacteroidota bacterium]
MQHIKRNTGIIVSFFLLSIVLQSCQYKPYLKYYFTSKKTHLPKFKKWDKFVGSNSNPLRSSYNITCYDWLVHVQPDKKQISSSMKIYFRMESAQDSIMLDMQKHLSVDEIKSTVPLKKYKRKKDVLFIVFNRELQKGEQVMLEISYHGQPVHMLENTAINWNKDKNNKPWICTATEGIGTHHMMPCKNMLNDEPDSCFIRVGVPKDLVGVSNGKLEGITETANENIYNWSVHNPINIYNISFNVGDYVKLEKDYRDIDGVDRKIGIYSLSYNKTIADTFYDQAPLIVGQLEKLYGTYPWWKDGLKIIETKMPNGLCMEHQSGISMTDAYVNVFKGINLTMVHEIAHEWWGNNISAFDYADLWLHEGFAQYSEALFAEAHMGKEMYKRYIYKFYYSIKNKRSVIKPYDVGYNNLIHHDDQDIYDKGAILLHTLRMELNNDSLFFKTFKTAQQRFSKSNITSEQFITLFNEETKRDFTPFFNVYLRQTTPPVLEYHLNRSQVDSITLEYKWANKLPENFKMKVNFWNEKKLNPLYPTSEMQQLKFSVKERYIFDIITSGYFILKERKD